MYSKDSKIPYGEYEPDEYWDICPFCHDYVCWWKEETVNINGSIYHFDCFKHMMDTNEYGTEE